ncbi:MFS transporter [Kribbella lupini]|uniref:MFS transporter n=1 Tax=Kribbella lupini TaxID=291602 RepID=A0ABN2AJ01_9ACTN
MTIATPTKTSSLPAPMRRLAAGWTLASAADNFLMFVLLWSAGPQGWSGQQTALLVVAIRLPAVLGGVLGGRAVDRFGPVPMLLLDAVARVFLMGALAISAWNGDLHIWTVLALGAAAGTTAPLSYAAARTLVPRLVEPHLLGKANALLSIGDQLPLLLGAILTGPALGLLGTGPAFLLPLAMLVAVAVIALRMRAAPQYAPVRPDDAGTTGARTWRSARVIGLISLSVAYYFTYGPYETVMPYFVREELGSGLGGYTVIWALFGAAALLTLPLAARLSRHRPGLVNAVGAIAWGALMLPLAFVHDLTAVAIGFAVSGAIWGPYAAIETTALHRWTDPADHGRIFGTQRAVLAIASPLGAAVGALGIDRLSPPAILAISAAGCALAGLAALSIRDLRRSR